MFAAVRQVLVALGVTVAWTGLGAALALVEGEFGRFWTEWVLLQGSFQVGIGTWLLQSASGDRLSELVAATSDQPVRPPRLSPRLRWSIVVGVGVTGTGSLVTLGFNAHGLSLAFMWVTCAGICFTAGVVTVHAVEILVATHRIVGAPVRTFPYAPARTIELRNFISHVTTFGFLTTTGYVFALAATLNAGWTGSTQHIRTVQLFWPVIYVPLCLTMLMYPHYAMHRLIRRAKDALLISCQAEMRSVFQTAQGMTTDDVQRSNALADLFDKVNASPDYVIDLSMAIGTIVPSVVNMATLVLGRERIGEYLRSLLPG